MNDITREIFDKGMKSYIDYFLANCSYYQNELTQNARCNLKLIKVEKSELFEHGFLKHKCFSNPYKSMYFTLPYDFLTNGERINFKDIRNLRYKEIDIRTINKLFGTTIDVFANGYRLYLGQIKIALFDNYFVVSMPKSTVVNKTTFYVLMRPYKHDKLAKGNEIVVNKDDYQGCTTDEMLVYVNHKLQTENYSIIDNGSSITVKSTLADAQYIEVTFIRHLKKYGLTNLVNKHLNLMDVRKRFPIPVNNILTFGTSGLFFDLNVTARTGNMFKTSSSMTSNFNLFYVYDETIDDENYYDDNCSWFIEYQKNIMDIINDPTKLPEFMNKFYLFTKEISLSDYIANNYANLLDYNIDRAKDSLLFNDELITKIYECLVKNLPVIKMESKYVDCTKYDLAGHLRTDTRRENTDPAYAVDFVSNMYLFQIPNIERYHINVYIDGVRYFDYRYDDYVSDIQNIYLKSSRVKSNSIIEFEFVKTKYNGARRLDSLGNNKNTLNITNAKQIGLIDSSDETAYIEIFYNNSSVFTKMKITDIKYDEEKDVLYITSNEKFRSTSLYSISNNNFCKTYKFDTHRRGTGFTCTLEGLELTPLTKDSLRIYKNGRELPSDCITKLVNGQTTKDNNVTVELANINHTVYELIEIEYIPDIAETVFVKDELKTDGKVNLVDNSYGNKGKNFINEINQYYILNGRRVLSKYRKKWCAKGMTLNGLKSTKHFTIKNYNNTFIDSMMETFYKAYETCKYLFSKYVVTIMQGSLTDDERDCEDINLERTGELYYDLYQEFLKHNIVNAGDELPEYIAFKYKGLVDEGMNNTIMIDATEEQLYWMPLDATMQSENDLIKIMDLYYKLLDDIHSVQVVRPNDIPDELYEKYKVLFNNNVLVLQVPNFTPNN